MTGDARNRPVTWSVPFILPPQQWALHNRQAQFDGFLQARRTQYLFDVRKRLKFIHVPVHIRKKRRVIDARIVFHTDDEEVVIRFEMRPKIQVEFSLWIVLWEEAFKIVVESDLGDRQPSTKWPTQ